MKLSIVLVSLTSALIAPACKQDSPPPLHGTTAGKPIESAAASAPAAPAPAPGDPLAAIPANLPAPFAAWDLPARARAWQGAWLTEESLGFAVALDVHGTAVTTWDGKAEKHLELQLESPCSAKLIQRSANGSSSVTSHYTLRGGKLVEGLGDAGARTGATAIACISNQILTLDAAGTCLAWTDDFGGRMKSAPATCGFAQKDGKEVFTAKVNGYDTTLQVDGDALLSTQLAGKASAPFADFAAAKAARK